MAKLLVVVVGPTAVGKTDLCIHLAKDLRTEVLSADSRQFYREMNIGTAKPTPAEMQGIPHHFVNCRSVNQEYSVGQYETDALATLDQLFAQHDTAILTGGSGLYIKAVCEGFDEMPAIAPHFRETLNQELAQFGLDTLVAELHAKDPVYAAQVDRKNPQRVIRALEVIRATQQPFSAFRQQKKKERPFKTVKIGLNREREELYQRINLRMDLMLQTGLEQEARSLYPLKHLNALQTVGYQELFGYFDGLYNYQEAVRLLKQNSRRYAKRQLTWFKADPETQWFHPTDYQAVWQYVQKSLSGISAV